MFHLESDCKLKGVVEQDIKKTTIFSKRIIFMHKSTSFACLYTSFHSEGVGEQRKEWFIPGKFIWIKIAKRYK